MMNKNSSRSPTATLDLQQHTKQTSLQMKGGNRSNTGELMSKLDPKEYKQTKEYCPDKLELWDKFCPGHENENVFFWINGAHKSEITRMNEAIRRIKDSKQPLPSWACQSIKDWWTCHYNWVKDKYILSRDFFVPRVTKRFRYPEEVTNAHDLVFENLQSISCTIENLKPEDSLERLHQEWKTYENNFVAFNRLQDSLIPLLYHAYFSPKEVADITSRLFQKASSTYIGAFIYFVGADKFRKIIMPRKNFPPVAWMLKYKKHYDGYIENNVVHLDALFAEPFINQSTHESDIVERYQKFFRILDKENPHVFNPFHPIYQVSKEHPPDKLSEWEEDFEDHIQGSPRYFLNNAHLAESEDMKVVLRQLQNRTSKLQAWEVSSIQKWFHAHRKWVLGVYDFHSTEVLPWLSTRIHYPTILLNGQKRYVQLLDSISDIVESLKPGDDVSELMTKWIQYDQDIHSFLAVYNRIHFMLVHAYFSRQELADYLKSKFLLALPWIGPSIYHLGKDMFRKRVMKCEKVGDVHWHLEFGVQYIDYCEKVAIHMKALKIGEAPHKSDKHKSKTLLSLLDSLWDDPEDLNDFFKNSSK